MRAVIIGAGMVGSSLAAMMREEGHNIVVVDRDAAELERIEDSLDVQNVVHPLSLATRRIARIIQLAVTHPCVAPMTICATQIHRWIIMHTESV